MINSLCGSVGSLKSENSSSSTKLDHHHHHHHSTSPIESSSISEINKTPPPPPQQPSDSDQQNGLTPPSLNFPPLKFEIDGDVEVQSPDSSIWETFFTDHLDGDFMISSPIRNLPSPQTSSYNNYNYNFAQSMQGQSLSGCSPPRFSAQVGAFTSSLIRAKAQSPLHKVFNSPGNQYMHPPENLALPAIEDFLEDYQKDGYCGMFSPMKICSSGGGGGSGSSPQLIDMPTNFPVLVECLAMPNNPPPSRFLGTLSESSSTDAVSQLTEEKDIYNQIGGMGKSSLSQQLQQEKLQEEQQTQQQQQNLNNGLMAPLSINSEQVKISITFFLKNTLTKKKFEIKRS